MGTAQIIDAGTVPSPNDLGGGGRDAIAQKGGEKMPSLEPELLDVGQELVGVGEPSPTGRLRRPRI